ncbi:MAG: tetratricopeptide repeat protein, partial [Planctomycetaceae bacterium]|nr:tetratricopeptide repeat protein [Planctomycetaceae bacterium]
RHRANEWLKEHTDLVVWERFTAPRWSVVSAGALDVDELHRQGIRYVVTSSFSHDIYQQQARLAGQPSQIYEVASGYESLFELPFIEFRPNFRSFGFSNPIVRVVAVAPVTAVGGSTHCLSDAERLLAQAEELLDCGQVVKAERRLNQAVILDPKLGAAHNNLGLIGFDRRELSPAAQAFSRAMELTPRDPLPEYNLAPTLESGGRLDEAIFHFEQAHAADPTNPIFLGSLLRARIVRGDLTDDLVALLQNLVFIISRPDWVEWARDELELMLSRARREVELELDSLRQQQPHPPSPLMIN